MMMLTFRLALRELRQGWRHFGVFLACLVLGVMVITGVGTMSEAVNRALQGESKALLGGDMELSWRGVPPEAAQVDYVRGLGEVSEVTTLRAMLRKGDAPLLVEVKAVDAAYPLFGTLKVASGGVPSNILFSETVQPEEARTGRSRTAESIAPAITQARSEDRAGVTKDIIVDPVVLARLDASIGDTVQLGSAEYVIADVLTQEPDRVVSAFALGPRVLMSHAALKASGLVTPQTLAEYRFRLKLANPARLEAVKAEVQQQLHARPPRIDTSNEGNDAVDRFLGQLTLFLSLAGLAVLLIGGIGIGNAVRVYLEHKGVTIATMKTLGASQARVFAIYATALLLLTLLGSAIGAGLSAVMVQLLTPLVAQILPVADLTLSWRSAALAGWYGLLIVYLFSLPSLVAALQVRPAGLFRGMEPPQVRWTFPLLLAEAALLTLLLGTLVATAHGVKTVAGFVGVALLAFLLFGLCGWLVQLAARRVRTKRPWLRLALGNLHRPGAVTGTVLLSIGSTVTVFIALTLAEANFTTRIDEVVKHQAPSLFLIDIQPDQIDGVRTLLESQGGSKVSAFPMVRGRVIRLNGKEVQKEDVAENVQWAIRGDRGFSYSAVPPENAELTEGAWWPEDYAGKPLVSVDERFLPGMGLNLGDTVTLDILGEEVTATLASARRIDYATFQINFAMMLSPGVLEEFPQSWVATVHLAKPDADMALMRQLAKDYPNVTVIRTVEAIATVKEVLGHIGTALRITVGLCLVAGLLVLASALSAMLDRRLYDTAILKVLGASRREIVRACTTEWLLLALVASGIAAGVGTLGAYLIVTRFPGEVFYFLPGSILTSIALCLAAVWVTGYLGNRQVFSLKPARLLRNE